MADERGAETADEPLGNGEAPEPYEDLATSDVPTELHRAFWSLVVVFNIAILAIALGVLFIVFPGRLTLGGSTLVAGLFLFGYGVYRYRRYRAEGFDFESDPRDSPD